MITLMKAENVQQALALHQLALNRGIKENDVRYEEVILSLIEKYGPRMRNIVNVYECVEQRCPTWQEIIKELK